MNPNWQRDPGYARMHAIMKNSASPGVHSDCHQHVVYDSINLGYPICGECGKKCMPVAITAEDHDAVIHASVQKWVDRPPHPAKHKGAHP